MSHRVEVGSPKKRYVPSDPATAKRTAPVSALRASTVVPGTTPPLLSRTTPSSVAVVCAPAATGDINMKTTTAAVIGDVLL